MVVDALRQVLGELDVKTTNFGQVHRFLTECLCVIGTALDPWCQQLGDMVQGILQQVASVASKAQILRSIAFLSVMALCLRLCLCPSPLLFAFAACQRPRLRLRQRQCLLLCQCLVCLCLRLSLSAVPVRAPTHDPTSARVLKMEVDYFLWWKFIFPKAPDVMNKRNFCKWPSTQQSLSQRVVRPTLP